MNLKNKILLIFVQTYQTTKTKKKFHIWKCHVTMPKKVKNLLIRKSYVTMAKRYAYISNGKQFLNHFLAFFHKNKSLPSATSILYGSSVAYNTTASLDKLACTTDYVDFLQMSRHIWTIFLVQKRFQLLGCKPESIQES